METGRIQGSICSFLMYKAVFLTRLHKYDDAHQCMGQALQLWKEIDAEALKGMLSTVRIGLEDVDLWPQGMPNLQSLFDSSLVALAQTAEVEGNQFLVTECRKAASRLLMDRADAPPHQPP